MLKIKSFMQIVIILTTLCVTNMSCFAQARMVFNNDGFINIKSGAYLVIDNPNPNAISNSSNGNIISESEINSVKWNIGNSTGKYIIPFTNLSLTKIPVELEIMVAGNSTLGSVVFSTYFTNNANLPYPSDVTNMDSQCGLGNSLFAVDRFWKIDAINYSIKPTPKLLFTYDSVMEAGGSNTIACSKLKAECFNAAINSWETPVKLYGQSTSSLNIVSSVFLPQNDFFRSWTLIDTTAMLVSKSRSVSICSGQSIFLQGANQTSPGVYYDTLNVSGSCDTLFVTNLFVNPLPSNLFLSANSLSITCSNPTVTANVSTTATPVSYSWSPTAGIVSGTETTANPVFNAAGAYSVVVTNTVSGCASNAAGNVITVSLNNTVPTIALTNSVNNGTITCTNTIVTISPTVTPSANLTYTWLPSGVTSSTINDASFTSAGIYTLAVTNTLTGCVTSLTNTAHTFTIIANNTPPTFTLGTAPSLTATCAAPSVTLSGSSNADPNSVYTWTTPSSSTISGNPVSVSSPGIYTVAVTNTINGCSSSAATQNTVEVLADAGIPNITLSANSISITCSNPTPSVAITTTASPVSYSWTPTIGIVPGTETTANPVFNAAGSYSVVVTNSITGCATGGASNIVNVSLDNTIPTITLSSAVNSGTITCTNTFVTISPTVTPSANLTYTWLPSGVTSNTINDATFTSAGVYTLVITNTLTGCASSSTNVASTYTIISNTNSPTVTVVPTSSNTSIGCGANGTVTYSLNTFSNSGNVNYSWLPGGVTTPIFSVTAAGIYTVIVTDISNSCFVITQFIVNDNSGIPDLTANSSAIFPCGALTTTISASSTNTNVSYLWTGPLGANILGETTKTPTVDVTGSYIVVVTDLSTGCINSNTVLVSQTTINTLFSASPASGYSPLAVEFTNQTIGATTYNWSFGNGISSTEINPATLYNASGTYTVILTAYSGTCSSTYSITIIVEDGLSLEIPNVFTPNSDGVNDVFYIKSSGVKELSLSIFNRWGQRMFEFDGIKAAWDGNTGTGEEVPDGTYFYLVKVTGYDSKVIEKSGTLNLFR